MKNYLVKLLLFSILIILINCCSTQQELLDIEHYKIKITTIDSLSNENYFLCNFLFKDSSKGILLLKKLEVNSTRIIKSKTYYSFELCAFQFSDSPKLDYSIYPQHQRRKNKRYFQICKNKNEKRIIRGKVKYNNDPYIGVSINEKGSENGAISDIDGNFILFTNNRKNCILEINPCCTCYSSLHIPIEQEVFEIIIECICDQSKIIIKKRYISENEIKQIVTKRKL